MYVDDFAMLHDGEAYRRYMRTAQSLRWPRVRPG